MVKKRKMNRLKKFLLVSGLAGILGGVFTPLIAHAHDAYYLSITLDADSRQYIGVVTHDKNDNNKDAHAEVSNTGVYFGTVKQGGENIPAYRPNDGNSDGKFKIPVNYASESIEAVSKSYKAKFPYSTVKQTWLNMDTTEVLPFSFPGRHVSSLTDLASKKRDADALDRQQAQWVNSNLVGSLNQGIATVYNIAYTGSNNQRMRTIEISQLLANAGADVAGVRGAKKGASKKIEIGKHSFTISDGRDVKNPSPDIPANHYIAIKHKDMDKKLYVPWAVPKGYGENQRLWNTIRNTNYKDVAKEDAKYLSWQHVVMQGVYNSAVAGVEFGGAEKLNPPNIVERTIAEVFTSMTNTIESMLGLHSIPELMLNRGSYAVSSWQGVMPKRLAEVADYVHLFVQFIAWVLLAGAFAKLLALRNLSAINPKMRVDLKEGAVDLIGAGFSLLLFIPIFRSLLIMNSGLVQFFGGLSDQADNFGTALMTNGGYIGPIIVGMVFFLLVIYMNITYILRGITIAALYVFAPLFIVSIAYGGRFKQLFSTFAKELVGMIFIQTLHAMLLGMYSLAFFNGASSSMLYTIILTASFIPITKFIKKDLLGINEGMGSAIAGGAVAAGAGFAITSAGSAAMAHRMKSGGTGQVNEGGQNFTRHASSGGSGGGGGGGQTFQTMLDNDTTGTSLPNHYAGHNQLESAKAFNEPKTAFGRKLNGVKESVQGLKQGFDDSSFGQGLGKATEGRDNFKEASRNAVAGGKQFLQDRPMIGKAAVGTAKAAGFAAAATAELAMGTNGISSTATRAMMTGSMYRGMAGKGGSAGGAGFGGSQSVGMPPEAFLDQYDTVDGQSGFLVSASKDNGDIVNVHDKQKMFEERGIEQMYDNDNYLMMKTSVGGDDHEGLATMYDEVNNGTDVQQEDWRNAGVEFVEKTKDGKMLIGMNKRTIGMNNLQQTDKHIMFDMKPFADVGFSDYDNVGNPNEAPQAQTM